MLTCRLADLLKTSLLLKLAPLFCYLSSVPSYSVGSSSVLPYSVGFYSIVPPAEEGQKYVLFYISIILTYSFNLLLISLIAVTLLNDF